MDHIFSQLPARLLPWYERNKRDLPWRRDRQPYHVWLSEIMLQQTRVEAVKGYYARFLEALPTIDALAHADPELLHKLWEGLGYYSRVRNLQKAAKQVMEAHHGHFPTDFDEIRTLSGIGDYTAGAIGSICFGLPTPAVDGNVLRVAARLTSDPSPIDDPRVKKALTTALAEIYPQGRCGDFTQALMELGATVCVPNGAPKCGLCPMADLCTAHQEANETAFPVKKAKKPRRTEDRTVFLLRCGDLWAMEQRRSTGLLAGLWQFPNVNGTLTDAEALALAESWGVRPRELEKLSDRTHIFTHIRWNLRGFYLRCAAMPDRFRWEKPETVALPTAFRQFVE